MKSFLLTVFILVIEISTSIAQPPIPESFKNALYDVYDAYIESLESERALQLFDILLNNKIAISNPAARANVLTFIAEIYNDRGKFNHYLPLCMSLNVYLKKSIHTIGLLRRTIPF